MPEQAVLLFATFGNEKDGTIGDLRSDLLEAAEEILAGNQFRHQFYRSRKENKGAYLDSADRYGELSTILSALRAELENETEVGEEKFSVDDFGALVEEEARRFPSLIPFLSEKEIQREDRVLELASQVVWGYRSNRYALIKREIRKSEEWKAFKRAKRACSPRERFRQFLRS